MFTLMEVGNFYVRQFHLKQGERVHGHRHYHDHLSILANGRVKLTLDGISTIHTGGPINIPANAYHEMEALEDNTVWYCVFYAHDHKDTDHTYKPESTASHAS